MMLTIRHACLALLITVLTAVGIAPSTAFAADIEAIFRTLNRDKSVDVSESRKSYPILFNAYLEMSEPPMSVGDNFNHTTIHPLMPNWTSVSAWAESNPMMADAIVECFDKKTHVLGLPYGAELVERKYQEADLIADIASGGNLRINKFPYMKAVDTMAAFTIAEIYRLMEAGEVQRALKLCKAWNFVARQNCDRQFLAEKLHFLPMMTESLNNLRDVFYVYLDQIPASDFTEFSLFEIPAILRRRVFLEMPEGDRVISEAMIRDAFDTQGQADPQAFARTFAGIQAEEKPLTVWGATKRWNDVAYLHNSRQDSLEKLELVYDDWWRRWRLLPFDPLLQFPTEFERINPVRYAAVVYALQDIESLFAIRDILAETVNGTAVAAGICAYYRDRGNYPANIEQIYSARIRKRISDTDLYNPADEWFETRHKYREVTSRQFIDTDWGRVEIDYGYILYSIGPDYEDNLARRHSDDPGSFDADIVFWPAMKAVAREQGILE